MVIDKYMFNCIVSVIVPVYNCEAFLEACITSILNQTHTALEILIIDDGSTDASPEICDFYAKHNRVVNVIHKMNEGAAVARKTGIAAASGDYVLFVDADDWIEPDFIERLLCAATTENAEVVIGTFKNYSKGQYRKNGHYFDVGFYDRTGLEKIIFPSMLASEPYYHFGIVPSMCAKLIKRDLAERKAKALNAGISFGEDGCFTYSVLLDCNAVYIAETDGYIYRSNDQSVTHIFREKVLSDGERVKTFFSNLATEKNWAIGTQLDEYMAYICYDTICKAITSPFIKERHARRKLTKYIDSVLPPNILKNTNIRKSSWKTRIKFVLIKYHALKLLSILLRIKRVRK